MPRPISEVTVRRQTGSVRKRQAKAARKRLRLRGGRRPKRLSAKQKAAVRKRKGTGFYKKIARLRSSLDLPATITGSISHRPEYIDLILEVASGFKDEKQSAREFAKLFIEKDPAFSNTDTGLAAILFEAYLFEKSEEVVEQFLETQLEGSDTTFLAIFEGEIEDAPLEKLATGIDDFCTFETLVKAGDTNHEDGAVSDVTILECTPKRQKKSKAAAQEPEPKMRTEGLLPQTQADYEAVLEEGGITDNAFMYLYPNVWEAATGNNGDIRCATEPTGVKWYCNEGLWLPDTETVGGSVDEATLDSEIKRSKLPSAKMKALLKDWMYKKGLGNLTDIKSANITVAPPKVQVNIETFKQGRAQFNTRTSKLKEDIEEADEFSGIVRADVKGTSDVQKIKAKATTILSKFKGATSEKVNHYLAGPSGDKLAQAIGAKIEKEVSLEAVSDPKAWLSVMSDVIHSKRYRPKFESLTEAHTATFPDTTRANRFAREIRIHARTIRPKGTQVYYEARDADHTEDQTHKDAITELCKKHGGKKTKKPLKEEEDTHALVAGPFLGDGEPRLIHNGHCEVVGFPTALQDGPLYLESKDGFQSKFLAWTVRKQGTDDGKVLVHVGSKMFILPVTLSEVKGLLDKMEEFYEDLPDEFDSMVQAYFEEYAEANGTLLCQEDVESLDLTEALEDWTSHEFIVKRDQRIKARCRMRRLAMGEDLDTVSRLREGRPPSEAEDHAVLDEDRNVLFRGNLPECKAWVRETGTTGIRYFSSPDTSLDEGLRSIGATDENTCTVEVAETSYTLKGRPVKVKHLLIDGEDIGPIDEATFSAMVGGFDIGALMRVGEKATTRTVKCPECDSKVLAATGYCVKCKKKTIKAEGIDEAFKKGKKVKWTAPDGTKMSGSVVSDVGPNYDIKVRVTSPKPKKGEEEVLVKRSRLKESIDEGKQEPTEDNISNYIRDTLSGTDRKTTPDLLFGVAKRAFKGLTKKQFAAAWKSLVKEGMLKKVGKSYMWESIDEKVKVTMMDDAAYYKAKVLVPLMTEAAKHGLTLEKIRMSGEYQSFKVLKGKSLVGFLMQTGKNTATEEHPWKAFRVAQRGKVGEKIGFYYKRDGGKAAALQAIAKTGLESIEIKAACLQCGCEWKATLKEDDSIPSCPQCGCQGERRDLDEAYYYTVAGALSREELQKKLGVTLIGYAKGALGKVGARLIQTKEPIKAAASKAGLKVTKISKAKFFELAESEDIEEAEFRQGDYVYSTLNMARLKGREHGGKTILIRRKGLFLAAPREVWTGSKWVGGRQAEIEEKGKKYDDAKKAAADLKKVAESAEDNYDDLDEERDWWIVTPDSTHAKELVPKIKPHATNVYQTGGTRARDVHFDPKDAAALKKIKAIAKAGKYRVVQEDNYDDLDEQMTATVPGVGKVKEPTHMKALARKAGKSAKKAIVLWGRAQEAANKQYPELKAAKGKGGEKERRYYKVVTAIFKNMLGLGKEESEQADPIIAEVLCHSCRSTTDVFLYPHSVGTCGECGSVHITPTGEVHYATEEEVEAADKKLNEEG